MSKKHSATQRRAKPTSRRKTSATGSARNPRHSVENTPKMPAKEAQPVEPVPESVHDHMLSECSAYLDGCPGAIVELLACMQDPHDRDGQFTALARLSGLLDGAKSSLDMAVRS